MTEAAEQPRAAVLSHIAFAIVLAIVIARCLMLETIRDATNDANAPPGPGAATSIVLDWLSFVPALLLLGRRLIDCDFLLRFTTAHVLLALLTIWTLASVAWADDRFLALISAARIAGGCAIFWSASQIVRRHAHLRVVVGVIVGLLLVNVVQGALYQNVELADVRQYFEQNKQQILAERGWREGEYVAQRFEMKLRAGEMLNFNISSNVLGALVVMAALAAIGAAMQRLEDVDDRGWVGALFIAALGSAYILAHTGSKASWAALGLGVALLAVWRIGRRWLVRHRPLAFSVTMIALALGVVGVIAVGLTRPGLPSDSLNFRWRYWLGSWPLVLEHPLTGVGWGNFADYYLQHRLPTAAEEIQDPHNFLVRWLVELGVVGLTPGVGWLIACAWQATSSSSSTGRGSGMPMRISRVLLACALALALTLVCTIDLGGDGSYAFLEVMRRSMFIALIAIAIALVCIGHRGSSDEPFHVDERPAPWLAAGLFVGVLMLLVQSGIDMTLFQPGPWHLVMLSMGALLGLAMWGAAVPAADAVSEMPQKHGALTPSPRAVQARSRVTAIAALLLSVIFVGSGILVGMVVLAENHARSGAAIVGRQPRTAHFLYLKAFAFSPVPNYDYAINAATAAMRDRSGLRVREPLDAAIAAAPAHAMSWLTRARYLTAQKHVPAADAQQAMDDFGRAIALNPNDVDLRIEYADLLERFGRRDEAANQLRTALALNNALDPAEPERLELRSPEKDAEVRKRLATLPPAATTQP